MKSLSQIISRAVTIALCFVVATGLRAQEHPAVATVFDPMPNYLTGGKIFYEKDAKRLLKSGKWGQDTQNTGRMWTVYSDRDNNVTYSKPDASSPKKDKLKFNEPVKIAEIKNGFAHVFEDPLINNANPMAISQKAKFRGWVPMSNLLPWSVCPSNDKGIYNKALLAVNLQENASGDLGKFYSNPDTKTELGKIATTMTFFYVMKTDPKTGLVLLGQTQLLDGSSSQTLYGWVNRNSFIAWNQRSCLEPNWNPADVEFFSAGDKTYPVYDDLKKKSVGSRYKYGNRNKNDKNPATYYRMDPYKVRYPILDNNTGEKDYYRCTMFGGQGRLINSEKQEQNMADANRKLEELRLKLQNINIIFVIDGTRSMHQNFAAVKQAIKEGTKYFDTQKFKPRIGVVIYRDYADGDAMIEYLPMVKYDDPRLMNFLDNVGNKGYGANSAPGDHDLTEVLYKGIEKGLDAKAMGYTADQANIMMVVGDCGNPVDDPNSPSYESLVKKMVDLDMNLISYQVRNSNTNEAWSLFDNQMSRMLRDNMEKRYSKLDKNVKVRFVQVPYGHDLKNNVETDLYLGAKRSPEEDDKNMEPKFLADLIEQNIGNFASTIQHQIDALVLRAGQTQDMQIVNADSKVISDMTLEDNFLRLKLGDELYNAVKEQAVTFTFTGFAPKHDAAGRNYWGPVVFMSKEEFESLMGRLRPVNDAANHADRKSYIEAVKGLLRAMIPDVTDETMDKMGMSYVMQLMAGLNESTETMKGYKLVEIADENVVPQDKYVQMLNDFRKKYKNLQNILTHPYAYSYTDNGLRYYWIPLADLP